MKNNNLSEVKKKTVLPWVSLHFLKWTGGLSSYALFWSIKDKITFLITCLLQTVNWSLSGKLQWQQKWAGRARQAQERSHGGGRRAPGAYEREKQGSCAGRRRRGGWRCRCAQKECPKQHFSNLNQNHKEKKLCLPPLPLSCEEENLL